MNKTLVSAQYTRAIPTDFYHVFDLGVKTLEREFDITIAYDVHCTDSEAKLCLPYETLSSLKEGGIAETVEYKLTTLFAICLDQF